MSARMRCAMRATTLDEPEFRERVVLDALARTLLPLADDVSVAVRAARQLLGWKPERWFRTLVANVLAWPEMRAGQMTAGELAARLSGIPSLMEALNEGKGVVLDLSAIPRPRMRRSPVAGMGPIVRPGQYVRDQGPEPSLRLPAQKLPRRPDGHRDVIRQRPKCAGQGVEDDSLAELGFVQRRGPHRTSHPGGHPVPSWRSASPVPRWHDEERHLA